MTVCENNECMTETSLLSHIREMQTKAVILVAFLESRLDPNDAKL